MVKYPCFMLLYGWGGVGNLQLRYTIMKSRTDIKEGYIIDYISGEQVKASPEELQAVQVFAKQLVEDYGYPKTYIQTRPQFRVKARPSDTKKEYPIDIAVFVDEAKNEDGIYYC